MLILIVSIFVAIAAAVTAFLLMASGNMKQFRKDFAWRSKKQLPLITPEGKLIDSQEDLEVQLGVLENKLNEKQSNIETSKDKASHVADNIEKLSSASVEVRKYYHQLKDEILRSEKECKDLQKQIEDYQLRQAELKAQMKNNDKNFKDLLKNIRGDSSSVTELSNTTSADSNKAWNENPSGTLLPISSNKRNKLHFECSRTSSTKNPHAHSGISVTSEEACISPQSITSSLEQSQYASKELDSSLCSAYYHLIREVDGDENPQVFKESKRPLSLEGDTRSRDTENLKNGKSVTVKIVNRPSNKSLNDEAPCKKSSERIRTKIKIKCSKTNVEEDRPDSSCSSITSKSSRRSSASNSSCSSMWSSNSHLSWKEFLDERKCESLKPFSASSNTPTRFFVAEKKRPWSDTKKRLDAIDCLAAKMAAKMTARNDKCKSCSAPMEKSKMQKFAYLSAVPMIEAVPVLSARSTKPKRNTTTSSGRSSSSYAHPWKTSNTKEVRKVSFNDSLPLCCSSDASKPSNKDYRQQYSLFAKFGIIIKNKKMVEMEKSRREYELSRQSKVTYSHR